MLRTTVTLPDQADAVNDVTERYGRRYVANAAGVTANMIGKVIRGEAKLSFDSVARLAIVLKKERGDRSLATLLDADVETDEPWTNGTLDDEVLDMDSATVEARHAFNHGDRRTANRKLTCAEGIVRRMRAEIRRLR